MSQTMFSPFSSFQRVDSAAVSGPHARLGEVVLVLWAAAGTCCSMLLDCALAL